MPKPLADSRKSEIKAAEKRISARGVRKPKHEPTPQVQNAEEEKGVDSNDSAVVESKVDAAMFGGITSQLTTGATTMTKETNKLSAEEKAAIKAEKEAKAAQAKAEKAAAAEAAKAEKAEKAAQAKAEKAAEKAAKAAEKAAEKAAKAAEKAASGELNVSMSALADKVKAGIYVKGPNGQLHSTDTVGVALAGVPPKKVVPLLLEVLGLESNPYENLNYGQQSMNLRNRLRGALNKDQKLEKLPEVTLMERVLLAAGQAAASEAESAQPAEVTE